jgi:hypothetical protein
MGMKRPIAEHRRADKVQTLHIVPLPPTSLLPSMCKLSEKFVSTSRIMALRTSFNKACDICTSADRMELPAVTAAHIYSYNPCPASFFFGGGYRRLAHVAAECGKVWQPKMRQMGRRHGVEGGHA